jgi:hypothetical protein
MKCKTINGLRECITCKKVKPIEEFYHRKVSDGTIRPYSDCKECSKKRSKNATITEKDKIRVIKKRYREKHKDELTKKHSEHYYNNKEYYYNVTRKNRLRVAFGITITEYEEILKLQNNKCAICGNPSNSSRYGLVVDHDHITGEIRSLLCNNCNTGIGLLKEDPVILQKAVEYINKHNNLNNVIG